MIKNEKQYKISKKKLSDLDAAIMRAEKDNKLTPLRKELILGSLQVAKGEIEQEVLLYETLKKDNKGVLKERLISELPSLLVEYKIRSGLTQKEFAEKLGLKEQQWQRYEAENFKSVTFKNLLKFLDAIGLQIMVKETRMTRTNKKKATRKKQPAK